MKRVRIDYTVYSPNYVPGEGQCWDLRNIAGAKTKARVLGIGSCIMRNFNKAHTPTKPSDWWQSSFCWIWNGVSFKKAFSLLEKKWVVVTENVWVQSPLTTRIHYKKR